MRRVFPLAVLVSLAAAPTARAQGSAFALRGLGWAARPVSARSAGMAGALAVLDPQASVNPAALGRWRSVAGWAVGAPTRRTFEGPNGAAEAETVRFPLFGFASAAPFRVSAGVSIADYLDRSYILELRDTMSLRGQDESYTDAMRSLGGVSDFQLGAAYRIRPGLLVGAGFHYYTGSTRLTLQRIYDNTAYLDVNENTIVDYRGVGAAVGVIAQPVQRIELGVSARLNGRLRAEDRATRAVATTPLAHEFNAGLRLLVVPGVAVAGAAQWAGWGRADAGLRASGRDGSRDTWSMSAGAEVQRVTLIRLRTPLRAGYRWRQLPFLSLGEPVDETAWTAGFSLAFAADRTTIDLAYENGTREAGTTSEEFRTLFVGLTIRP